MKESSTDAAWVKSSIGKMARYAKRLYVVMCIVLVLCVVIYAGILIVSSIGAESVGTLAERIAHFALAIFSIVICSALIGILAKVFKDVSKLKSPFTVEQARRLTLMGILLVAYTLFAGTIPCRPNGA